jgi:hypothetical protein
MSALAATYNIIADQGATFRRALVRKDSQKRVTPLVNYTARMQVRPLIDSSEIILNLTTENNGIVIDAPKGQITIQASAETTSTILSGKYVYDLELISPDGGVERLVMGSFTVRGEVTR